jgi:3-hydroxybutyryl-CoA dehydratase
VSDKIRTFDDVAEGMSGTFTKTVSENDIRDFAAASGDINPIHLDEAYAKTTMFGGRIAHGILTAGMISAAFGTVFPGPGWIYVDQYLKFKGPVRIGDAVTATVTATKRIVEKGFIEFTTICRVGDKIVLEGTATLMAPRTKKAA